MRLTVDLPRFTMRAARISLVLAVSLTALALAAPVGAANSENAALCRAEWESLVDPATGVAFSDRGECVSYGARGGSLGATTANAMACESVGGSFGADDQTGVEWDAVLWTCNGYWTDSEPVEERHLENALLAQSCMNDVPIPNTHLATRSVSNPSAFAFTCGLLDPFNA